VDPYIASSEAVGPLVGLTGQVGALMTPMLILLFG
jgi:hypothetical protein